MLNTTDRAILVLYDVSVLVVLLRVSVFLLVNGKHHVYNLLQYYYHHYTAFCVPVPSCENQSSDLNYNRYSIRHKSVIIYWVIVPNHPILSP